MHRSMLVGQGGAREIFYHRECILRLVFGSVGHALGMCSCPGAKGVMDDPPWLSKRDAARAAYALHTQPGKPACEVLPEGFFARSGSS